MWNKTSRMYQEIGLRINTTAVIKFAAQFGY